MDELDLQLMNDCMGAIADPNIVKIDTNYDSRVNLPDFGLFAVDYGYSNDPNLPGSHDPNCERSDFNFDHRVDLADLEVLAQNWLTLVFDEYRICGLCNIGTNTDPNEPDTTNVIDSKDYDALMADWYKQGATKIDIELCDANTLESLEPNQPLSGNVLIQFNDTPKIARHLFLKIDNDCVDNYDTDFNLEGTSLLDTAQFLNGKHQLRWGYYTFQGGAWLSEPNSIEIYNKISLIQQDEEYYPRKDYHFSGVYDGAGTLEVSFNDPNVVYTTAPGPFAFTSPASTEPNCSNSIQISAAESVDGLKTTVFAASKAKSYDPNEYKAGDYLAVLWLPDSDVANKFEAAIENVEKWWNLRGIKYQKFVDKQANFPNFYDSMKKVGAKYFVAFCHSNCIFPKDKNGNEISGNIYRTGFHCWKGDGKKAKFTAIFSWLGRDYNQPDNYYLFPKDKGGESRFYSVKSLNLSNPPWQVWIIGCYSLYCEDMPIAWGFTPDTQRRVYFGNRGLAEDKFGDRFFHRSYCVGLSKLIQPLTTSGGGGLGNRLLTGCSRMYDGERRKLFGEDGQIDADVPQGNANDDNFYHYPVLNAAQLDNVPIGNGGEIYY